MAAIVPSLDPAKFLSLPARHFAVVDAGQRRARILVATVSRGRPRCVRTHVVDAHEEGFTTADELRDEVRQRLQGEAPEAVVLVLPQNQVLRHVLDVPPGDADATRAHVEQEASRMGGLSERPWVFDAVRLRPFGGVAHPVAAAYCRQDDLDLLLESFVDDAQTVFDVRPSADSLAAAFADAAPRVREAILIDLGARHTSVILFLNGQPVVASAFPSGSNAFTEGLAADRGGTMEAAEVLKRTEPPSLTDATHPRFRAAVTAWLGEITRTLRDWQAENPGLPRTDAFPVFLAGGGALQPGLVDQISALGERPFEAWPKPADPALESPDLAASWGALLLALGRAGPAPSLLPSALRAGWNRQRVWRALVTANMALAAMLAIALAVATVFQTRLLAEKSQWREQAMAALGDAEEIRAVALDFNARLDAWRPLLERQRLTVDTLQVLTALQRQRTNADHWYVLLADAASYASGSNDFPGASPRRPADGRTGPASGAATTNGPNVARTLVAEVCVVPRGEQMRQILSDLVGDLKRNPVFQNVDVLPAERRRELVASNLIFPDRHFALELNLSDAELLPPTPVPRLTGTNREPRLPFRSSARPDLASATNGSRAPRLR